MQGFKPRENNVFAKVMGGKEDEVRTKESALDEEFAEILAKYSPEQLARLQEMLTEELAENESADEHAVEGAEEELEEHSDDSSAEQPEDFDELA